MPLLMKKNEKNSINYACSSYDEFLKVLVIYDPFNKALNFYSCASEIAKFREKIKLINTKKYEDRNSTVIVSRNCSISLYGNSIKKMEKISHAKNFSPFLNFFLSEQSNKEVKISEIFHPFFFKTFELNFEYFFENNEFIHSNLLVFIKGFEPIYFLTTSKRRIFGFPFSYNSKAKIYFFFTFKNQRPISFMHFHKNCFFICDDLGNSICFHFDKKKIDYHKKESKSMNNHIFNFDDSKTNKARIFPINLLDFIKKQFKLSSCIKNIIQIKNLTNKNSEEDDIIKMDNFDENNFINDHLCFLLEDSIVCIFSIKEFEIIQEFKGIEDSIKGVFYSSLNEIIALLTHTGFIEIFSLTSGRFERKINLSKCFYLFNLREKVHEISDSFNDEDNFKCFKIVHGKNISKCHSILEFNKRNGDKVYNDFIDKKSFLFENNIIGDLKNLRMSFENIKINVIWLIHYGKSAIIESKSNKNGAIFLKLFLQSKKSTKYSNIGHILLFDVFKNSNLHFDKNILENKISDSPFKKSF